MVGIAEEPPRQLAPSVGNAAIGFRYPGRKFTIDNIQIAFGYFINEHFIWWLAGFSWTRTGRPVESTPKRRPAVVDVSH
jgi:hypothetical protein